MITGILFFTVDDGLTGGLSGGSEEPGLRWLGSVGELRALRFFRPRVASVNSSSPTDDMM